MTGCDNAAKTDRARRLRREQTDPERRFWYKVRNRRLGGYKFVRQEPIGPYFADCVCRDQKLVVERDGGQHAENARDISRDAFLVSRGYRVLRFWNHEIMTNLDGVLETIWAALETPLPARGERCFEESEPLAERRG